MCWLPAAGKSTVIAHSTTASTSAQTTNMSSKPTGIASPGEPVATMAPTSPHALRAFALQDSTRRVDEAPAEW